MSSISLAIIGHGRIGKIHAKNILSIPDANLSMIVDPLFEDGKTQDRSGIRMSRHIDSLIGSNDIDGVIICSPSKYHLEQIRLLSGRIRNIFCEKPLGLSIKEIMKAKKSIEDNDLNLHVGFNRRFDPDFSRLKENIIDGEIGKLHTIKITSRDPSPPSIEYIERSGGLFLDMTIHDFDMVKYLSDSEICEIYAKGKCMVDPEIAKANDIDTAITNMTLKNGIIAIINNSRQAVYGYDQRIEVIGSKGALQVGNQLLHGVRKGTENGFSSANPKHFFIDRYQESYRIEMLNFIRSIKGDPVPHATADDGLHALMAGIAANRSLTESKPIPV